MVALGYYITPGPRRRRRRPDDLLGHRLLRDRHRQLGHGRGARHRAPRRDAGALRRSMDASRRRLRGSAYDALQAPQDRPRHAGRRLPAGADPGHPSAGLHRQRLPVLPGQGILRPLVRRTRHQCLLAALDPQQPHHRHRRDGDRHRPRDHGGARPARRPDAACRPLAYRLHPADGGAARRPRRRHADPLCPAGTRLDLSRGDDRPRGAGDPFRRRHRLDRARPASTGRSSGRPSASAPRRRGPSWR